MLRLMRQANQLQSVGRLSDAIATGERATEQARIAGGDVSESAASVQDWLAPLYESHEDWSAARKARETSLSIRRALYGDKNWRVTDARLAVEDVELRMQLSPEQRRELADSDQLTSQAVALRRMGEAGQGIELANRALEIRRRLLGPEHSQVAMVLNQLGTLYGSLKQNAQAENSYRQALEICRKILFENHPNTAQCLQSLAVAVEARGAFTKAEPLYLKAFQIRRKTLGKQHASTAESFDAVVRLRRKRVVRALAKADFASARRTQSGILQMLVDRYGEKHWRVTDARLAMGDVDLRERLSPEERDQLKQADKQERERRRLLDQQHYREAVPFAEGALAIRRKIQGDEHRDTARCLNDLGALYSKLKEHAKVEPLGREALAIRSKVLGEEHPETALSLNNMAKVYESQGDDAKAEPYFRRALIIRSRLLGDRDADTLASFENLTSVDGRLVRRNLAEGNYAEARKIQDGLVRLLATRYGDRDWRVTDARLKRADIDLEAKLSPEARAQLKEADRHDDECRRLNDLKRWRDALAEAEEAFKIRKTIQGEGHVRTAKTLNFVAVLNHRLNEDAKATPLYLKALETFQKILGDFHPSTLVCLENLADAYVAREEYDKAEPLSCRILEARLKIDGDKGEETTVAWDRLLALQGTMVDHLLEKSDYAAAKKIQGDKARFVARRYGVQDWHVTDARLKLRDVEFEERLSPKERDELKHIDELESVGWRLFNQSRYREALVPEEQALAKRQKLFGDSHQGTALRLNLVAVLYEDLHADAKVEPLYQQALQIRRKALGELHPLTALSLENLAEFYENRGKLDQAEPLYRQALAVRQRVQGEKDDATLATFNRLMKVYRKRALGNAESADYAAARQVQEESIRLLTQRYGERNWQVTDARLKLRDMELRQRLTPEGRAELKKTDDLDAERVRLSEQERYREALVPALEALEIRKRIEGAEHPDTADSLILVGAIYFHLKDYAKAESSSRQALEVRKKLLGEEHPDTANSLNNVAVMCLRMGDEAQAEPLYLKAVEIRMRLLGKKHKLTLGTFNDLVKLQPKMVARSLAAGDYATARRIQDDLVRVLSAEYGKKDSRLADARLKLRDIESREKLSAAARDDLKKVEERKAEASRLVEKHQYREAISPALEVFDVRFKALGPEHADTIASCETLDVIYRKVIDDDVDHEDYSSAARVEGELAHLLERRYGEKDWRAGNARWKQKDYEHCAHLPPEGRASLKRRDALVKDFLELRSKGAYREALRLAEEALALDLKIFGDGQLESVSWLNYVAATHSRLKENDVAELKYEQVLKIVRKALGTENPRTAFAASNLAKVCESQKKFDKALPLYQEALSIRRRLLGETDADTRTAYDDATRLERTLAERDLAKGDYASARRLQDDLLSLLRRRFGEKDWRVTDAQLKRKDIDLFERLSPEARAELKKAGELIGEHLRLFREKRYAEAGVSARQAFEIRKRLLGDEHRDTAAAAVSLGFDLRMAGDHAAARPIFERTLAIRRKIFGEQHRETALSYGTVSMELESVGDYAGAIQRAERDLAIERQVTEEDDANIAICYTRLGDLFLTTGECTTARGHFERALAIYRKIKGDEDHITASIYSRLGSTLSLLGDRVAARRNLEQALAIQLKVRGEDDPETAELYGSLGDLASAAGQYKSARANYERALAISRKLGGAESIGAANAYAGLATVLRGLHDNQGARQYSEHVLAIHQKLYGEANLSTASAHNSLGVDLEELGEYAEAQKHYETALGIDRKLLGEDHFRVAAFHQNLAMLNLRQGKFAAGFAEEEQALAITQGFLARMFGSLSEDQQLALQDDLRSDLDCYLTLAHEVRADAAAVYAWVLKCKGAVTAEQFLIRLQRRKSGVAKLFDELQATSTRLSALDGELSELSSSNADRKDRGKRLQEIQQEMHQLNARSESLQQQLVAKNSGFRQAKESAQLRPADIQKVLPPKSALVDFIEYWHSLRTSPSGKKRSSERRLMAFVIRPEQPIQMIELGSAKEVADKINAWNREVVGSRGSEGAAFREALGKLVWKPLESFLNDVDTVVISPDGSLCQFPFAVLPGTKPGSYLLEERRLAVIPVPRLLPQLLASSYAAANEAVSAAPLIIGNVDYESDPGTILLAQNDARDRNRSREPGSNRAGGRLEFKYLPGTKEEMEAIDQLYRRNFPGLDAHVLAGVEATEQAFRDKAPRHRWVHLATHGYFLPPSATDRAKPVENLLGAQQEMRSSHPGLWSGIALAGANGRVDAASNAGSTMDGKPPRDDGKLTALEVEGLDLMNVDLIVLSACQTALGRLTRGEGMLGLQRAFQLAGAKTAVTSLWSVDDSATRVLMTEFYRNLWEKKLPKLEALRQAQLRMLREYDPNQMKLISRGLDVADGASVAHKRGSPYFWAAFVLSGDWR
jgi:CHAT domain-containing protein/tetratricopeptide (TPR) repeat protein